MKESEIRTEESVADVGESSKNKGPDVDSKELYEKQLQSRNYEQLSNFIEEKFILIESDHPSKFIDNMNILKEVDGYIIKQAIAKMDYIVADYNNSGQVAVVISLLVTVFTFLMGTIFETGSFPSILILIIALLALLIARLGYKTIRQKKITNNAIYFKTILEEIK